MNKHASARPKLALIAGPTASGKSSLALELAERSGGVVINADSAQVYRDLRIVTARPSAADERRAPHRLYGYRDAADPGSAADWAADARAAIAEAHRAQRPAILVGGTGLYLRTLIEGIAPVPPIDPEVRAEVRALGVDAAHEALSREDRMAAVRIRPTDTLRVARALEVIRSTGRTLRDWQAAKADGIGDQVALAPLILLPPRDWLHARCDARFAQIFSDAGIAEVEALLARGLPASAPIMRAIGVPEIAAYLRGALDRDAALEAGWIATRRYAKRQYTWFRHQPPSDWPRFERALDPDGLDAALETLRG